MNSIMADPLGKGRKEDNARGVTLNHTLVHEALQQLLVQGLQGLRGLRIEQVANLVVAGDLMHAEQGLRIVVSMGLVHAPLKLQKRGALHEKDRKRAQPRICHAVVHVLAPPTIGQLGQRLAHELHHRPEIHRLVLTIPAITAPS